MKAAFVVFFAIVAAASASVLPWALSSHDLSGVGLSGVGLRSVALSPISPWALSHHAPAAVDISPIAVHAPLVAAPLVATPIVAAPLQHEAVSVTANRGSVHVAPLPGHAVSSSQLNLAPAPGTW